MSDVSSSDHSDEQPSQDPIRIVVVGGSYAGLSFIQNFLKLADGQPVLGVSEPNGHFKRSFEITLIDERDGFLHVLGTPLSLTARQYVKPFWKQYSKLNLFRRKELRVVQGSVTSVDMDLQHLAYSSEGHAKRMAYDYCVFATGLRRAFPIGPVSLDYGEYVKEALSHIEKIEGASDGKIAVIGGGAVGIEIVGEIKNHHPEKDIVMIHSRSELLSNEALPQEMKDRARITLEEEGVEVMLNQRPKVSGGDLHATLTFADGTIMRPSLVVQAFSKWEPSTAFLPPDALDEEKYIRVHTNLSLECDPSRHHFAIGDAVPLPGIKRAGAAMAMGRLAAINVFHLLLEQERDAFEFKLREYPRVPPMMTLAVGKQAILYGPVQGLKYGTEVMKNTFGDDLGWNNTLKFLDLADVDTAIVA